MVGGIAGGSTFAQEATQMLRSFKWGIGLYSCAWNIAFVDVFCRSVANVALCDGIQYVDGDTLCSNFRSSKYVQPERYCTKSLVKFQRKNIGDSYSALRLFMYRELCNWWRPYAQMLATIRAFVRLHLRVCSTPINDGIPYNRENALWKLLKGTTN